jgi:multiple sugar transport system ATP-binding protein
LYAHPITLSEKPSNLFVARFIGPPAGEFHRWRDRRAGRSTAVHQTVGYRTDVPENREASYGRSAGKPVIPSVRPDHILRHDSPAGCSIRMTVKDAEPLRPHTLVMGSVGRFPFTVQLQVGDMIEDRFDLAVRYIQNA